MNHERMNRMFEETFAKRLAALRTAKGVTQEEAASHLAVSDKTLSKWENGASSPTPEMIAALACYYEVSADYLLGLKEEMTEDPMEQINRLFAGMDRKEAAMQAFALVRRLAPAGYEAFCKDPAGEEAAVPSPDSEYHSQHRMASGVMYHYSIASEDQNLAVMLMRNKADFSWMKDPSCGEKMAALLAFLSDADVLAVCHFLHSERCTQYFTAELVGVQTGISVEKAKQILEQSMQFGLCSKMVAHLAEGESDIYNTYGSGQILTIIALAYQCTCDLSRGYAYHYNSRLVLMKGDASK